MRKWRQLHCPRRLHLCRGLAGLRLPHASLRGRRDAAAATAARHARRREGRHVREEPLHDDRQSRPRARAVELVGRGKRRLPRTTRQLHRAERVHVLVQEFLQRTDLRAQARTRREFERVQGAVPGHLRPRRLHGSRPRQLPQPARAVRGLRDALVSSWLRGHSQRAVRQVHVVPPAHLHADGLGGLDRHIDDQFVHLRHHRAGHVRLCATTHEAEVPRSQNRATAGPPKLRGRSH
mmetsp:Transcript_25495/g.78465  ORF Transcript_25495/g.78465 Transcript_25495/m.78465 type:complete len:236 (+) Transcript_25495:1145-1852(+)